MRMRQQETLDTLEAINALILVVVAVFLLLS